MDAELIEDEGIEVVACTLVQIFSPFIWYITASFHTTWCLLFSSIHAEFGAMLSSIHHDKLCLWLVVNTLGILINFNIFFPIFRNLLLNILCQFLC